MRKTGIFALCVILLLTIPQIQAASFMTGVRCGLNLATWRGNDVIYRYKTLLPGLVTGLELQTNATDFLAVVIDVFYSQKGIKWENLEAVSFIRQHFIELPMLVKFLVPNPSIVKPFLNTGPYFAFSFLSKDVYKIDGEVVDKETVSDYYSRIDFGMCFGSGMDVIFGKTAVSIGIRYDLGFISMDDDHIDKIKNSALTFICGFSWAY
jgi:hypothetical protein